MTGYSRAAAAPAYHRTGPPEGAERERLLAGVGALLVRARVAAGLSQAQLTARAGLSKSTVGKIEQGRSRPAWRTLVAISDALHPTDPVRARALAADLADGAGASLAGDPRLPPGLAREQVVHALVLALAEFGLDVDDDRVRQVVAEKIRVVTGTTSETTGERREIEGTTSG